MSPLDSPEIDETGSNAKHLNYQEVLGKQVRLFSGDFLFPRGCLWGQ